MLNDDLQHSNDTDTDSCLGLSNSTDTITFLLQSSGLLFRYYNDLIKVSKKGQKLPHPIHSLCNRIHFECCKDGTKAYPGTMKVILFPPHGSMDAQAVRESSFILSLLYFLNVL